MTGNLVAALTGLVVGSFLNIIIIILSQDDSFRTGRPLCPHCQHPLPWSASFFLSNPAWLGGRCRVCGQAMSSWPRQAVSLAAVVLALALWRRFPGNALLLVYVPFTAALLVLTVLDLQHLWLPDLITLPGIGFGLISALILPRPGFRSALLGAILGWAFFRLAGWAFGRVMKNQPEGLGRGDAKLAAFIGAVLGLETLPRVLLTAAVLGSLAGLLAVWQRDGDRFTAIPYGPFLAGGALLFLFWKA